MEGRCFFEKLYSCLEKDPLSQASAERIITASKQYGDGLHIQLEEMSSVSVHRKCVDKYCHKRVIQKALREGARSPCAEDLVSKPKRARRSGQLNFSFLQHCLFCGERCDIEKDPKHPGRWRPAYVCREGESRGLKEAIYEACGKRTDMQSDQIRVRMAGVLTDLHAADVRYHVDCKATFLSPKSIQAAIRQGTTSTEFKEVAFDSVVKYLAENRDIIYNSIDVYTKYMQEGGILSRRKLITKLIENFGGDMISLSSPGISSLLAFKSSAAKVFHTTPDDDIDGMSEAIEMVAKKIKSEIDSIEIDRNNYHSHVNKDTCSRFQSNTLEDLLSKISQKPKQSLPALLIGNNNYHISSEEPSHSTTNSFGCVSQGFQRTSQGLP